MVKSNNIVQLSFALDYNTGIPIFPKKGVVGKCPYCGRDVISKCGNINTDHFAHDRNGDCISFYFQDGKTLEHRYWQSQRNPNVLGQTIEKKISTLENTKFADIICANGSVCEVQCSPMDMETRIERERDYDKNGNLMQWLIPRKQLTSKTFYDYTEYWEENEYGSKLVRERYINHRGHNIYIYDDDYVICCFPRILSKRIYINYPRELYKEENYIKISNEDFAKTVLNDPNFCDTNYIKDLIIMSSKYKEDRKYRVKESNQVNLF